MQPFLQALYQNSSIFTIGEYAASDVPYLARRLNSGALSSSLNFPLLYVLKAVFIYGAAMSQMSEYVALAKQMLPNHMHVLGNFVDK